MPRRSESKLSCSLIGSIVRTLVLSLWLASVPAMAQTEVPEKVVNHQAQFWTSVNSTARLSDRWGLVADFHLRRNNFATDPSFYFARAGAAYWTGPRAYAVVGYAHMWLAVPGVENGEWAFAHENRIYQQFQWSTSVGQNSLLQRFRLEQRWVEQYAMGLPTGSVRFTHRIRYLMSWSVPVFKHPKAPKLMIADEILLQMGPDVVYNPFDQNRLSLGIQQKLGKGWSFDLAYMYVYQQKFSGYQYDANHTLRWFFYYAPDFRKKRPTPSESAPLPIDDYPSGEE